MPGQPVRAERLEDLSPEARYHGLLELGEGKSQPGRDTLYQWLGDADPMLRNAAARALWERGERSAAGVLIRNLHRENRTFVTMDAIYHLRAMTGEDLGYDPNLGYREQTLAQERWWLWWQRTGGLRPAAEAPPEEFAPARAELARAMRAARENPDEDPNGPRSAAAALWSAASRLTESRWPTDQDRLSTAYELLVERHPDSYQAWANLAWSTLNAGDFPRCEEAFRRALSLAPEVPTLNNDFGIYLEAMGRTEQASEFYRKATELDPGDDVAWANLGDTLSALGLVERGAAAWTEAEDLAPEKWYYHRLWRTRQASR